MVEYHSGLILIGNIDGNSNTYKCVNMADPTDPQDYATKNYVDGAGVTDHGSLSGLGDDDHSQYLLISGSRAMSGDLDVNAHYLIDPTGISKTGSTFGIYLDTDNNGTGESFSIYKNGAPAGSPTLIFRIDAAGDITTIGNIGTSVGTVDGVDISSHNHSGAGQGGTISSTYVSEGTKLFLTTERVQDIVGAMFSGNTETRITATYQDGDGTIDLVVNDMEDDLGNHTATQDLNMNSYNIDGCVTLQVYVIDQYPGQSYIFMGGPLDLEQNNIVDGNSIYSDEILTTLINDPIGDGVYISSAGVSQSLETDDDINGGEDITSDRDINVGDDCDVTDDLDVGGSKDFKIDHPLDPENKFLKHASIEGPEVRTIYHGQVETTNGKALVKLQEWWEALNGKNKEEFNYQLTPIGQRAACWISKEIENNEFEISSDVDCKIAWQISGIRHDRRMEERPFEVETIKNQEVIKHFPEKERKSDKLEYDSDLHKVYKTKHKDFFLNVQKPHLLEVKKKLEANKILRGQKKEVAKREDKKSFNDQLDENNREIITRKKQIKTERKNLKAQKRQQFKQDILTKINDGKNKNNPIGTN